jgi:hypothetical protein
MRRGRILHDGVADTALLRPARVILAVTGAFALYGSSSAGIWRV